MSKNIEQYIESVLTDFSEEFLAQRIASLQRKKVSASGQLAQSLDYSIKKQAEGELMELLISFEDYGRFIDMRKLNSPQGGDALLDSLVDWINKKGLRSKMIRNNLEKRPVVRLFPKNIMYRIAWGIISKWKSHRRRRQWWNKPRTAAVAELYNRVLSGLPDATTQQISNAFNHKK